MLFEQIICRRLPAVRVNDFAAASLIHTENKVQEATFNLKREEKLKFDKPKKKGHHLFHNILTRPATDGCTSHARL